MTPEEVTTPAEVKSPSNPFPGLRPFEFDESHLYFGRDGQSDQLIRKLAATRFVAVVGTSGSGKSSLVRAGLLPDLFGGFMADVGSHWRVCLMRPGNDPLGNLASELNTKDVFGSEIEENALIQTAVTEATLRRGSLGLVEAVRQNRMPQNESLLVIVDQFEELFRFARVSGSEQYRYEAAAFVKLLLEAARQRELNIYVVLTMRSDFLGDCSIFWGLPEAINDGQYLIPRMTRDQRAEAITGPIAVGGGQIAQRLVNRLLNDTGDNPDMLPILQHALMRTWENWAGDHAEGEPVDLRHYEAVGTMTDGLSRHADEAFNELKDERSRLIAERVFKALTEKGEDNREVRRPTVLRELCALSGASLDEVAAVVKVFRREGRSFLMPSDSVPLDEESLIDISHESLIRNWQRLKEWVDEESQSAQIYQRLAETAVLHEGGRAGLWRDPDLQLALDWRERTSPTAEWGVRYHPAFDSSMSFLDASVAARDAAALEEERRRRREIRRTRIAAAVFFLLFMLSLGAFAFAYTKTIQAQAALGRANEANEVAQIALAQSKIDNERANQQTEAARRSEEVAKEAKVEALLKQKEAEESNAQAQKSAEAARLSAERAEVSRRDAEAQRIEAEKQKTEVETQRAEAVKQKGLAEEESANSRRLLYASDMSLAQQAYEAGNIRHGRRLLYDHQSGSSEPPAFEWSYLWNLFHAEKETERVFSNIFSSVMSADGKTLVVGIYQDFEVSSVVELRDAATRKVLKTFTTGMMNGNTLAVSPDAKLFAYSSSIWPDVTLVDAVTGKASKLEGHKAAVTAIAFSPDGMTLAVGTALGPARSGSEVALWDVATAKKRKYFVNFRNVITLAYKPDGAMIAVGEGGGMVRMMNATSGQEVCSANMRESAAVEEARFIAFSPSGDKLVAATDAGSLLLFNMNDCDPGTTSPKSIVGFNLNAAGNIPASSLAFSPDGDLIAVSYSNNTVEVWRSIALVTRTPLVKIKAHQGYITSVAFLPDSRTLITTSRDNSIKVWDTAELARKQAPLAEHSGIINAVAFSPDGKRLITGGADGALLLRDTESGEIQGKGPLIYGGPVNAVAYSPDGKTIVSGGERPTLMMLDADTYKEIGAFPQQRDKVLAVSFSPDGARLVTCDVGESVRLWDAATRTLLKEVELQSSQVRRVAFSPDGRMIAAVTHNGLVKLWDGELSKELGHEMTGDFLSASAHSLAFSPDGRVLAVGFLRGKVTLWKTPSLKEETVLEGSKGWVFSLAFSPDGRTLASGDEDGAVRLWAMDSGKELLTLRGHTGAVMSLAFSRDGKTLASAGSDQTVRLWRAPSVVKVQNPNDGP